MEALVRYPDVSQETDGTLEELRSVKQREGRLRIAFTLLLSVNLALAFGAVTLFSLLIRETLAP